MPIQRWSEHIWVVSLADEPELSDELHGLLEKLQQMPALPSIVLDLSGVQYVNSSNLSQMLRIRKVCVEHDASLRMVASHQHVWATIITTGLDKVFEFAEDVPNALASLQIDDVSYDPGAAPS